MECGVDLGLAVNPECHPIDRRLFNFGDVLVRIILVQLRQNTDLQTRTCPDRKQS